jgi:hypothetical protein
MCWSIVFAQYSPGVLSDQHLEKLRTPSCWRWRVSGVAVDGC